MSTVLLFISSVLHPHTKYIKVDLYFVRDKIQRHQIIVSHISLLKIKLLTYLMSFSSNFNFFTFETNSTSFFFAQTQPQYS